MNDREIRILMGVVKRQAETQKAGVNDELRHSQEKLTRLRTLVDDRAESLISEVSKRVEAESRSLHSTINALEQKLKEKTDKHANALDSQCGRVDELSLKLDKLIERVILDKMED